MSPRETLNMIHSTRRLCASGGTAPAGQRVLALYEPARGASATLDLARDLAEHESAKLTVLNVAPQATTKGCCGMSSRDYNQVVQDATAEELRQAQTHLGRIADRVTFKMLIEGTDPPLHEWIARHDFDIVLLPGRRRLMGPAKHPEAARVQASTTAEVRIVDPQAKPTRDAGKPSPTGLEQASA